MTDFSTCTRLSCRNEVPGAVKVCPKCGGRMQTSGMIRGLGIVSIVCGLVIVGLIGTISLFLIGPMLHPGVADGGSTYNGTAGQAVLILALFAVLIVFGLTAVASGSVMAATGRRSLVMIVVTFVLAAALVVVGGGTYWALSRPADGTDALGKPVQTES